MMFNVQYGETYISYGKHLYKVINKSDLDIKSCLIGDINTHSKFGFPDDDEQNFSVVFQIVDHFLHVVCFKGIIVADDLKRLEETSQYKYEQLNMSITKLVEPTSDDRLFDSLTLDAYEILFSGLEIPHKYSGKISAAQLFDDEIDGGGMTIDEISIFDFENGKLIFENSNITDKDETFMSRFTWEASNMEKGHQQYYIEPFGTMAQHELLMSTHIYYRRSGEISKENIDCVIHRSKQFHPVLRAEYMWLSDEDGEYVECEADLVLDFIMNQDNERLRWVYDYIDFEKYPNYPNWIVYEVFNRLRNNENNDFDWNRCVEILMYLFRKGLRCTNTEELINEVKSLAPNNPFQVAIATRYIKEMTV